MTRKNPYAFKSKKMESQYQQLKSKFHITRQEFATYYENVRKANKKGQNLKRYGNALYRPHYSTEVGGIKSRKEFTGRQKSLQAVLSKNFRQLKNLELRTRFYANLSYTYGQVQAEPIINQFMTLTDAEMMAFLDQNKDIEVVYYDSDQQSVSMYLSTIGMTLEKWYSRL